MTIFVNRSIPLSEESRNGWRNAGAVVLSRNPRRRQRQLDDGNIGEAVLVNLGLGEMVGCNGRVYNEPDSIRAVITPAALRRTMPDLIPTNDVFNGPNNHRPYWIKGPGQHGENKRFCQEYAWDGAYLAEIEYKLDLPGWDAQLHIVGTEFRVITVGDVVVQAHKKTGTMPDFTWEWVGVGGIKDNGLIPLVKNAVALVPNGDRCVFGWDVIVGETGAYIIEGNSSPGVNDPTARRIVDQIRRANENVR